MGALKKAHGDLMSGHFGVKKTSDRLSDKVTF